MKKLFTFVAVLLLAITASADVIWSESLDRNGTYINKDDFGGQWPYANQWYEAGNFAMDYDSVNSYSCSVRNKKINGASENTIGFYYTANKGANNDAYLQLYGVNAVVGADAKLIFDICSDSKVIPDSIHKYIEIIQDGKKLVVPALKSATETLSTVKVEVPMNAGTIDKLFINKIIATAGAVFITSLRIDAPTAVDNVFENVKATKMVENGQIVIIRNGVKYNTVGAVVE